MSEPTSSPRILYAVTSSLSADTLLRGQLAHVASAGFEVTVVSAPGRRLELAARREGVDWVALPMRRELAPVADLMSWLRFYRLIRRLRPTILNASTPKAGLLSLLAARLARVPVRIYTLRGLRLETTRGLKRRLLAMGERAAARAAHRVVAVSASLARRFDELGLGDPAKVSVLGAGSSNGVRPLLPDAGGAAASLRRKLGLPAGAPVVGYVGRLTRDKGVAELATAFAEVGRVIPAVHLLLVGDFESGDPVPPQAIARLTADPRVVITGFVSPVDPYYRLMDVLALPSHREGFPNAPLEAAMAGVPTVGFAATGTVDAIVDGATGALVRPGDAEALAAALRRYLERPELAAAHGAAARRRAEREFRPERVWGELIELYRALLAERGVPAPVEQGGSG